MLPVIIGGSLPATPAIPPLQQLYVSKARAPSVLFFKVFLVIYRFLK